jgi:hypothetical protein
VLLAQVESIWLALCSMNSVLVGSVPVTGYGNELN